ncbi:MULTISPECIES: phosphate/phosphite/phosphonate ABC transporter substrate-binding protein [unclassified Gemella]|uniref:phosphate/phosphite/phosphonate ABC transporter substrate-binding protein n=1 Tax=unclassified Gemella TaxID=2624949 RepID=UPI001C05D433|nr:MULTISPECIES: phosphate/phosphite/phosphonate ABC transporter substrate-binding protein [unclassified Gemella]MBU0278694.1 phosphate/phosphite/phosphonate ABC transporter substrate-binding protein [Gemella sp. zg-1178]QWQ39246.1 phosphate/phosphite/phosphonate ABC transporter substrate-binding protein [Gemella sp. zg-570]
MKKLLLLISSFILIIALTGCSYDNKKAETKVLKMGLVPTSNSEKLIEDVQPIANKLSEKLGVKVEAFTASNYIGVIEGLNSGSVDFGLIPPFSSLLATSQGNAKNILTAKGRDGQPGYKAVILVRKNANINSIEDLKNKKVAFVDPSSTSGYIYPGAMIVNKGLSLEKDIVTQFTGGHDKSLQLLLNGDVDAIGSYENLLNKYAKDFPTAKDELKVLATSDLIPGITITVSNSLDADMQKKLKNALLELQNDKETMELMTKLYSITGFEEVNQDVYKKVEETAKSMNVELDKVK